MNLRIFDNLVDLHAAAARTIVQRAQAGARSIALSGGSTPKPLYTLLGKSEELRALPITWVIVDERYVPIDHPESNAGMIEKTLFADGMAPSHRFLRFRTELNDPAATARAFEDEWRQLGLPDRARHARRGGDVGVRGSGGGAGGLTRLLHQLAA